MRNPAKIAGVNCGRFSHRSWRRRPHRHGSCDKRFRRRPPVHRRYGQPVGHPGATLTDISYGYTGLDRYRS